MNTDFQDQDLGYEGWDCPTCMRPTEKEDDHECPTCGMWASHHLNVTTMCKIIRETKQRESCLIMENQRLKETIQSLQL